MASLLGSNPDEIGANLLVEASKHQHKRVELWHWFYLLLRAPMRTVARSELIDTPGMNVDRFIKDVEAAFDLGEQYKGIPPTDLLPTAVSPDVMQMLDRAETLCREHRCPNVSELEVTLAVIERSGEDMTEFFADALDREKDGLERFKKTLFPRGSRARSPDHQAGMTEIFESEAPRKLRLELFSPDGQKFCKRWREDMAAIGIKTKATTRHLL